MELINLDKSHFIMAFSDRKAMSRMAQKCESSSLIVVHASSRKELALADANAWFDELELASADTNQGTAASLASALSLLNRMNGNKEDYYVLVIRKNFWA